LYFFKNQLDTSPKCVVDLRSCLVSVTEVGECKTEGFVFTLIETQQSKTIKHVASAKSAEDHESWLRVLIDLGVKPTEDDEQAFSGATSILGFVAKDIYRNNVGFKVFLDKICIIVNVASK